MALPSLVLYSSALYADTTFTELSHADAAACASALQTSKAVVVWQFQDCPFADDARAGLSEAKAEHADISNVNLFYFNAMDEAGKHAFRDQLEGDTCSTLAAGDEHDRCEVVRSCLQMKGPAGSSMDANPEDGTGSPTIMMYRSGQWSSIYDLAKACDKRYTPDVLYAWVKTA